MFTHHIQNHFWGSNTVHRYMNLFINNQEIFETNSSILNIHTRNKHHLHRLNANLSCFQKSKFSAGIKIVNNIPHSVTILKNDKTKFKAA